MFAEKKTIEIDWGIQILENNFHVYSKKIHWDWWRNPGHCEKGFPSLGQKKKTSEVDRGIQILEKISMFRTKKKHPAGLRNSGDLGKIFPCLEEKNHWDGLRNGLKWLMDWDFGKVFQVWSKKEGAALRNSEYPYFCCPVLVLRQQKAVKFSSNSTPPLICAGILTPSTDSLPKTQNPTPKDPSWGIPSSTGHSQCVPVHLLVPGVVLDLEDGRGEAEALVAVPGQHVPLRHDVVGGGADQLVPIPAPAAGREGIPKKSIP